LRRLGDRFAEAAESCADVGELRALLGAAALELGFDHYALLDHSSLSGAKGMVRIDNYPESWVNEMVERGFAADDPVHLASRRACMGFSWTELSRFVRLDRRHRRILARSRHHGIGPGFTVPANMVGQPSASCSFAVRAGAELPTNRLRSAELVGAHALRAARRLRPLASLPLPRLSRREVECLKLVARGKTDWEIARILALSPHTARQYVKRARAAYDSVSRTQVVVYALRDAWIDFEDAIPPNGRIG
jgi:LuxR family quorum-sensing system transcriptional regulator CciR